MKYALLLVLFALLLNVLFALPMQKLNSEESSNFFGGEEMLLDTEQKKALSYTGRKNRNGLIEEQYRWPNNTVYYEISSNFSKNYTDKIERAMREIESHVCIKFKPRSENITAYIIVVVGKNSCGSNVGYKNRVQGVTFSEGCPYSAILHEFGHTLGLYHQHSASNRDDYVSIKWDNIQKGAEENFIKYPPTFVSNFGIKYDYESIMHYRRKDFSKNNKDTIVPLDPKARFKSSRFSKCDIKKLRIMYKCDK